MKKNKLICSKKATWAFSDLLYWFLYIPLTAIIIALIAFVPFQILDTKTNTYTLENAILSEMVYNKISYQDPVTERIYAGIIDDQKIEPLAFPDASYFANMFSFSQYAKKTAFKLSFDKSEPYYYDKEFYEIAFPLAVVRYYNIDTTRQMIRRDGTSLTVELDQMFSKKTGEQEA